MTGIPARRADAASRACSARRRESARSESARLLVDQRIDKVDDQQRSPGANLPNGPLLPWGWDLLEYAELQGTSDAAFS
jgi:hypothetical protein